MKVREMTVSQATEALKVADAALQTSANAFAAFKDAPAKGVDAKKHDADKVAARKALREAALDFATANRNARSAKQRETANAGLLE